MTLDEHAAQLQNAIAELAKTQVEDCTLTTLDIIAGVKLRLAENGGNSEGAQFTDYSPIYGKQRAKRGLQQNFKDFNFSGRLYASIQPEVKGVSFGVVEVDIVPRGQDNEAKVAGQMRRENGNILTPNAQEIQDATDAHTRRRFERAAQIFV